MIVGLRGQARTGDPKLPKLVRYQLRYTEVAKNWWVRLDLNQ